MIDPLSWRNNSVGDEFLLLVIVNSIGDRLSDCERNKLCFGENITDSFTVASLSWGELTPLSFSYSVGNECTFNHFLQLGLSLYLVDRAIVWFGHFSFAPVSDITSNHLLFRM